MCLMVLFIIYKSRYCIERYEPSINNDYNNNIFIHRINVSNMKLKNICYNNTPIIDILFPIGSLLFLNDYVDPNGIIPDTKWQLIRNNNNYSLRTSSKNIGKFIDVNNEKQIIKSDNWYTLDKHNDKWFSPIVGYDEYEENTFIVNLFNENINYEKPLTPLVKVCCWIRITDDNETNTPNKTLQTNTIYMNKHTVNNFVLNGMVKLTRSPLENNDVWKQITNKGLITISNTYGVQQGEDVYLPTNYDKIIKTSKNAHHDSWITWDYNILNMSTTTYDTPYENLPKYQRIYAYEHKQQKETFKLLSIDNDYMNGLHIEYNIDELKPFNITSLFNIMVGNHDLFNMLYPIGAIMVLTTDIDLNNIMANSGIKWELIPDNTYLYINADKEQGGQDTFNITFDKLPYQYTFENAPLQMQIMYQPNYKGYNFTKPNTPCDLIKVNTEHTQQMNNMVNYINVRCWVRTQ